MDAKKMEAVLREFISDIESTGGIQRHYGTGCSGPVACPDWEDLAVTYFEACNALGHHPIPEDYGGPEDGDYEDDDYEDEDGDKPIKTEGP